MKQKGQEIKYNRAVHELQDLILFSISVAGKNAKNISNAITNFYKIGGEKCINHYSDYYFYERNKNNKLVLNILPFRLIKRLEEIGELNNTIKKSGLGQHNKLTKAFSQLANSNIDLRSCTVEDLENFHGISFKTSRFFLSRTRKDFECAVLDTHILAELEEAGYKNIPKNTPQSKKKYREIEEKFINYARNNGYTDITEFDLKIWRRRSNSGGVL